MRTLLSAITLAAFLLPATVTAGTTEVRITKHIGMAVMVDDFDDTKTCGILVANDKASIMIFPNHSTAGKVIGFNAGNVGGVGLKYRVDKKEPVVIGFMNEEDTRDDNYYVVGDEYTQIINDFKAGSHVFVKVTSSNQFIDDAKAKISLAGFTKAYNMAVECK